MKPIDEEEACRIIQARSGQRVTGHHVVKTADGRTSVVPDVLPSETCPGEELGRLTAKALSNMPSIQRRIFFRTFFQARSLELDAANALLVLDSRDAIPPGVRAQIITRPQRPFRAHCLLVPVMDASFVVERLLFGSDLIAVVNYPHRGVDLGVYTEIDLSQAPPISPGIDVMIEVVNRSGVAMPLTCAILGEAFLPPPSYGKDHW